MARVLAIDSTLSGAAGDMITAGLAQLVSSSNPEEVLMLLKECLKPIEEILSEEVEVLVQQKHSGIFRGIALSYPAGGKIIEFKQLHRAVMEAKNTLKSPHRLENAFDILVQAELEVHQSSEVHLHELGTLDTLVDLYLPLKLMELLEISALIITPINTGSGVVKTSHGPVFVPAPATQKILEKHDLPTSGIVKGGELLTPTGAALLAVLKTEFSPASDVVWEKSVYGFGQKDFDWPNCLRVRLGVTQDTRTNVSVVETHVDDVTGEDLGNLSEVLLREGGLDVVYYPIMMKKSRPGWTIRLMAKVEDVERLATILMKHTGSLGVRILNVTRHISQRSSKTSIEYRGNKIRLKVGDYGVKFEYDDLRKVAEKFNLSPKELSDKILFGSFLERNH